MTSLIQQFARELLAVTLALVAVVAFLIGTFFVEYKRGRRHDK